MATRKKGSTGAVIPPTPATTQAAAQQQEGKQAHLEKLEAQMRTVLEHVQRSGGLSFRAYHESVGGMLTMTLKENFILWEVTATDDEFSFVIKDSITSTFTRIWSRNKATYKLYVAWFEMMNKKIQNNETVDTQITTSTEIYLKAGIVQVQAMAA